MTSVLSAIPPVGELQYTAQSVQKMKVRILKMLEENRMLLEDFLEEKLAIEKKVVNLTAERDL